MKVIKAEGKGLWRGTKGKESLSERKVGEREERGEIREEGGRIEEHEITDNRSLLS